MEVTFQNKREDFQAFYDYILKEPQEGKKIGKQIFLLRQRWVILCSALLGAIAWGILGHLQVSIVYSSLLGLSVFAGFLIATESLMLLLSEFKPYYSYGKEFYKNQEKLMTERDLQIFQIPRTLTIDDNCVEVRSSESLHRWKWGLVDSIGLTPDFIFLHVGKCCIFYIPKRDFPSEQNFVELGKKLVELEKKNKGQPIAVGQKP